MKKAKLETSHFLQESVERKISQKWITEFEKDSQRFELLSCPSQCNITETKLETTLFKYLSDTVPYLLKETQVGGVIKFIVDEDKFQEHITTVLEEFICGQDCKGGFHDLKSYGKPSKFCGKVFNVGDPTYSCK